MPKTGLSLVISDIVDAVRVLRVVEVVECFIGGIHGGIARVGERDVRSIVDGIVDVFGDGSDRSAHWERYELDTVVGDGLGGVFEFSCVEIGGVSETVDHLEWEECGGDEFVLAVEVVVTEGARFLVVFFGNEPFDDGAGVGDDDRHSGVSVALVAVFADDVGGVLGGDIFGVDGLAESFAGCDGSGDVLGLHFLEVGIDDVSDDSGPVDLLVFIHCFLSFVVYSHTYVAHMNGYAATYY